MLKIDDVSCYGNAGSRIVLFRRAGSHLQVIFDNNAGDITVLKTSHMGVFDLELDVPGMNIPIWKWNGRKYGFWRRRSAGQPTKASSATQPPVAAAPFVPDRDWSLRADDGLSSFGIGCHTGGDSIGFTFYLEGYRGNALKRLKDDIRQPFVIEINNRKFPTFLYMTPADGGWVQEQGWRFTDGEASAFLDAFGQDGRLALQTGKGVEVASWTLKGTAEVRESVRKIYNLKPGLSVILCVRLISSLSDEPFAEDNGELGLGLEPLTRRPFPFLDRVVENEI
jgi:hypothetical protein